MSLNNLSQRNGKWVVDGEVKKCWVGRVSFKLANMLSKYFAGMDGQKWLVMSERWVEHNQELLGEDVILRVLGETKGGWNKGHPMFGTEPVDAGIWDLEDLRKRSAEGRRIEELTELNKKVIGWLMKTSHETGVAFEYVVDATLKHTPGLGTADNEWLRTSITNHAIRQTCAYMRELWLKKYPKVKIIVEARNEWTAHNKMKTKLNQVNMWANRMYRWEREHDGDTEHKLRFKSPGSDWHCRQWPEGYIVVDRSVGNDVHVGTEPGEFQMGLRHPDRDGKWWELPDSMEQDRGDCNGAPLGFNESILCADEEDEDRLKSWYGGGYTTRLNKYLRWMESCKQAIDYYIIHDEKGMQCDVDWPRKETRLEAELRGSSPPPSPPEPPGPTPPAPPPLPAPDEIDYSRVIGLAYRQILGRAPDTVGLRNYNQRMRGGLTEASLREILIRSVEFKHKNSD